MEYGSVSVQFTVNVCAVWELGLNMAAFQFNSVKMYVLGKAHTCTSLSQKFSLHYLGRHFQY